MRKISGVILSVCLAISLAACGSSSADYSAASDVMMNDTAGAVGNAKGAESFAVQEEAADYEAAEDYEYDTDDSSASSGSGANESVASNRKLIKRVNLSAETQEFDKLTRHIENKVESLGGYMESSNVYSGSSYGGSRSRTAEYTARVPVDKMSELVLDVGDNANITNKSESAEDITLNYVDSKSRKEALQVEYDRLMEILKQAEDVDTIVALESRITEV
ncbi:MAG: DUF4349 domain-containing protein, partial [Lachnospiraceae bacterium]|nr:DUF4349 domain-containing protein [Lachnospiraceae bacterium]